MSTMHSKQGPGNSRFLYDSNGNVVGRGVTGSSGKTIYTGTDGQYIGKSYDMPSGTSKYVDSNNEYIGTGITHKNGISSIDCSDGMSIENGADHSSHSSGVNQKPAHSINKPSFRPTAYAPEYIVKSIISIVLWALFVCIVLNALL